MTAGASHVWEPGPLLKQATTTLPCAHVGNVGVQVLNSENYVARGKREGARVPRGYGALRVVVAIASFWRRMVPMKLMWKKVLLKYWATASPTVFCRMRTSLG